LLFNSYSFIFIFLPITLVFFFIFSQKSQQLAISWLAFASLFFYGWWNPSYLFLLLASITFNFILGKKIFLTKQSSEKKAKYYLILGITANISLLVYYKYLGFLIENINGFSNNKLSVPDIILPLGISVFTFTQLAFLIDTYHGLAKEFKTFHYALFVTYFPHLIAGPVLHHKEMMPQFSNSATYHFNWENMAIGFSIFFIGLFKKLILADDIAEYAKPVFDAAAAGQPIPLLDNWGGVSLQFSTLF
jgi:D-alanyl-lipoteichoic acid acyltransferase DltB (MBOAT superfamily)